MERYYLEKFNLEYFVKPSMRAKHVYISIEHPEKVVITKPRRISYKSIHSVVEENINTIHKLKVKASKIKKTNLGTSQEDYINEREEAKKILSERTYYWAEIMGISYSKVVIRFQSTRWGSCSSTGTISLNYKLIKLPQRLQDYVIIHELAHRKEMNHSSKFWEIVEQFDQNYKQHRKELGQFI